jgi:hypothetical protein
MTAPIPEYVREVLAQSLVAWRVSGEVRHEADDTLLLVAGDKRLRIARAPADLPFRWMVAEGERTRGVISIAGLLRTIRAAVDPGYHPIRLRLAPQPLLPP